MAKNNIVDISFGQQGSTYVTSANTATPPAGRVFSSIYMLEETVFESVDGLVAAPNGVRASDGAEIAPITYINSNGVGAGTGGLAIDGVSFPGGTTIYGRYSSIDLLSGSVIAYSSN